MPFPLAPRLALALALAGLGSSCNDGGFSGSSGKRAGSQTSEKPKPQGADERLGTPESGEEPPAKTDDDDQKPHDDAPPPTGPAAPPEQAADDPLSNIDAACQNGGGMTGILGSLGTPIAPAQQPMARTAPEDCRQGVEMNNYDGVFDLPATAAAGSRALKLEVDIASYTAPDRMRLIAVTGAGERVILDTCRLRTASYSDPTGGVRRPPEDSIRYFRPALPKGTKALRFDWSGAPTPTYIRVVGLCDFSQTPKAQGGAPELRTVQ